MPEGAAAQPAVAVAVVSWNTRELLLRCLASFEPDVRAGRAEVWVVDNGSEDGSAQAARDAAPWATVLEPGANLGFGRAVNEVARRTRGEWLVAANADVALRPGALAALLAAGQDPRVGCAAPRLVLPGGETQDSVHALPTLPFTLAFNAGLHRLSRGLARRMLVAGAWDPERTRDVPWAVGALLLLRRAAFDAVGAFDERLWMYAEDLDLGWRLHDAGWRTRYVAEAEVLHESGAAARPAFGEQEVVSRFMGPTYAVVRRRRGLARARATAAVNLLGVFARLAWMIPMARRADARDAEEWEERIHALWGWRAVHRDALRRLMRRGA